MYNIGIGTKYDRIVAVFMGCIAVIHSMYIVWMIAWSYRKKQLVFAVYNVVEMPKFISDRLTCRKRMVHPKGFTNSVYKAFFTRDGLLGVDGPYFDVILFFREITETSLQTYQAYRMSLLLPRAQMNRWYVGLLVVNCWIVAFVHSAFHSNATKRRVWSLISDCVLSMATSMGISTVLVTLYIGDFDFEISGFPLHKWYEDVWVVNATSEFNMVLVTSWPDLMTRIAFAIGVLGNLDNIKMAMRAKRSKRKQSGKRATMIAPFLASGGSGNNPKGPNVNLLKRQPRKRFLSKVSQMLFFVWGLVILTLHLYAESMPQVPQCWMQIKPWASLQSSCSLLVLDCYADQLVGAKREVLLQWNGFDPTSVMRIVVRHCPAFELPEVISTYSALKGIKVYNSTIVEWDDDSALTGTNHPKLMTLFLVRVNFSNGELPLGLQSNDFPRTLADIEFCVTNLRSLPDDLDLKWPQYASIYIEASELEEVPTSLVRLAPYDLSLSMNPIATLPAEIFEQNSIGYLSLGSTRISQLPEKVTKFSSLLFSVNLSYTNLSFFWPWIDTIIARPIQPSIALVDTPYCSDLERIFAGEQLSFTLNPSSEKLSILSDASRSNWDTLRQRVDCEDKETTWYPIAYEDQYSGIY